MDLIEFLKGKSDVAITWSAMAAVEDATLTFDCSVDGTSSQSSREFQIRATGVTESQLNFTGGKAVYLSASRTHPLLWDYGGYSSIVGNAPLPDPPRFFHEFYQLVRSELGVARDPVRYLNWNTHLSEWLEFVYSRSYQLLSAPAAIAEAATELLDVQAAEYVVLPDPPKEDAVPHDSLLALVLDDSWLVCQGAEIIL